MKWGLLVNSSLLEVLFGAELRHRALKSSPLGTRIQSVTEVRLMVRYEATYYMCNGQEGLI